MVYFYFFFCVGSCVVDLLYVGDMVDEMVMLFGV